MIYFVYIYIAYNIAHICIFYIKTDLFRLGNLFIPDFISQPEITCSKLTIETLEKGVNFEHI